MRQHLQAVARATGENPPDLAAKAIPDGMATLARAYFDLHGARGSNGFALNPLTHLEIWAWQRLSHVRLTPWEVETLFLMDRAALTALQSETNLPKRDPSWL